MHISIATKKIAIFNHKKLAHVTLQKKKDGIFFFKYTIQICWNNIGTINLLWNCSLKKSYPR